MVSIDREIIAAGIIGFFLVSTAAAYIGFSDDLDVQINSVEEYRNGSEDSYRAFEVNITNTGDRDIKPELRVISNPRSGPYFLETDETVIESGKTAVFNGSMETSRRGVLFGSTYQIVVEDTRTDDFFSESFSVEGGFNKDKNPFLINSKYYPFHWTGSAFGKGRFNANISGRGLNGSFQDCNNSLGCGFEYRDDYELREKIVLRGKGYRLDESTVLEGVVEDGDRSFKIPVNFSGSGDVEEFNETISLKDMYENRSLDFSADREVKYTVRFQTVKDDFHWVKVEEFDFRGGG